MQKRKAALWTVIFVSAIPTLLLLCGIGWYFFGPGVEKPLQDPVAAASVCRDLATLCQTCRVHPEWFEGEPLDAGWMSAVILRPNRNAGDQGGGFVRSDNARFTWGGGFHHYGYALAAGQPLADGSVQWTLHFFSEGKPDRIVGQCTLLPAVQASEADFVKRALAEYDRRIANSEKSQLDDPAVERVKLIAKHPTIVPTN